MGAGESKVSSSSPDSTKAWGSHKGARVLLGGTYSDMHTTLMVHLANEEGKQLGTDSQDNLFFFGIQRAVLKNMNIISWTVGGRSPMRALWNLFASDCQGVVFALGSSADNFQYHIRDILMVIENAPSKTPLLILFNDEEGQLQKLEDVISKLEPEALKDTPIELIPCDLTSNAGKDAAIAKLRSFASKIVKHGTKKSLSKVSKASKSDDDKQESSGRSSERPLSASPGFWEKLKTSLSLV